LQLPRAPPAHLVLAETRSHVEIADRKSTYGAHNHEESYMQTFDSRNAKSQCEMMSGNGVKLAIRQRQRFWWVSLCDKNPTLDA
jgi:hypothetical protein